MIMSTWSIIMMIESPYNNLHRISETRYISSALKITWAIYQRSDNKTIKPLFWHINWLNLWRTGPTRYRWMSVRVRERTLFFYWIEVPIFQSIRMFIVLVSFYLVCALFIRKRLTMPIFILGVLCNALGLHYSTNHIYVYILHMYI